MYFYLFCSGDIPGGAQGLLMALILKYYTYTYTQITSDGFGEPHGVLG